MKLKNSLKSLSDRVKSAWNYVKPIVKSPYAYLAVGSIGFLSSSTETKAQTINGHYIHGKITSGSTAQGLEGIRLKAKLYFYDGTWPPTLLDSAMTTSDISGDYVFGKPTKIEDNQNIETQSQIKYYWNKIEMPTAGKIIVYNIQGREILEKEGQKGINQLTELDRLADQIFIEQIKTNGKTATNKLVKITNPKTGKAEYSVGKINGQTTNATKHMSKIKSGNIWYGISATDTTGQFYNQLQPDYSIYQIDSSKIDNIPLLEKKNLDNPFTNPDNGQPVNTTKDMLFFVGGTDILPGGYWSFFYNPRPYLVYFGRDLIPSNWNEQDIIDGTLDMLAATKSPVDTSLWKESTEYLNPFNTFNTVFDCLYKDSTEMQGNDLVIGVFRKNNSTESYELWFNKQTAGPNIKRLVKTGWWYAIGTTRQIPVQGYLGSDTTTQNMPADQEKIYSYLAQISKPVTISGEMFGDGPMHMNQEKFDKYTTQKPGFMKAQDESYQIKIKIKNGQTQVKKTTLTNEERRAIYKK